MGLYNERLLQQLLSQDHKKSLEDLFQHTLTFEAAEQELLKRADSGTTNSVNALSQRHKKSKLPKAPSVPVLLNHQQSLRTLPNKLHNQAHVTVVVRIMLVVHVVFVMLNV